MKIRTGFVSNSSSSSFILVGVALTSEMRTQIRDVLLNKYDIDYNKVGDHEALQDYNKKMGTNLYFPFEANFIGIKLSTNLYFPFEANFVGIKLASFDYDVRSFTIEDIEVAMEKCRAGLADFGIDENVKIYAGTESC